MDKDYINNLIDEINKIEFNSIVEITQEGKPHKYEVKYDYDLEEIELISLEEKYTIYGTSGEIIKELKENLLCDGIWGSYQKIIVL